MTRGKFKTYLELSEDSRSPLNELNFTGVRIYENVLTMLFGDFYYLKYIHFNRCAFENYGKSRFAAHISMPFN